jgi:ribosomal protein S18 acetylase RimI-like enzyme
MMHIRTLSAKTEILSILAADRLYAAYPLGDLTDGLFEQCEWVVAERDEPVALAMTFNGLMTPSLFVMGQSDGVSALLRSKVHVQEAHLTLRMEHEQAVATVYELSDVRRMHRMYVDRQRFKASSIETERLHSSDLSTLNDLYRWGGPGFFAAYQLEQGVYYGARAGGKLIAAAGTHVVAPEYGIAAVGNVYTHPDYRGRGYATACTGAVTAELLTMGCSTVVLNVRQDNTPAVRAYQRLGYTVHCPFIEAHGQRLGAIGQIITRVLGPNLTKTQETDDVL